MLFDTVRLLQESSIWFAYQNCHMYSKNKGTPQARLRKAKITVKKMPVVLLFYYLSVMSTGISGLIRLNLAYATNRVYASVGGCLNTILTQGFVFKAPARLAFKGISSNY